MAFTVTNTFTSATNLTGAQLDANFTDVANKLNGGITNADLTGTAGITNANLATSHFQTTVELTVRALCGATPAAVPAANSSIPIAFVALPGTSSTGDWTVDSASYFISDCGTASNTSFWVDWGGLEGGTSWVQTASIVASTNIAGSSNSMKQATLSLNSSSLAMHATNPRGLALFVNPWATNAIKSDSSYFVVTLKLRRTDGLV